MLNRSFVPIVEVPRNRKCHQQGHWNARTTMFSTHVVRPDCDWNASKNAKECVTREHVDPSISLWRVERTSGCLLHYPDRNDNSDLPPFTGTFLVFWSNGSTDASSFICVLRSTSGGAPTQSNRFWPCPSRLPVLCFRQAGKVAHLYITSETVYTRCMDGATQRLQRSLLDDETISKPFPVVPQSLTS